MAFSLLNSVQSLGFLLKKSSVPSKAIKGQVFFIGSSGSLPSSVVKDLPSWNKAQLKNPLPLVSVDGTKGPLWFIHTKIIENKNQYGLFSPSPYAMARDLMGSVFRQALSKGVSSLVVEYFGEDEEEFKGLCIGLEMAHYSFPQYWPEKRPLKMSVSIKSSFKNQKTLLKEASQLGQAVNLSRFLVDLPPNALHPKSYAELLKGLLGEGAKTQVTIWNEQRLKKEKMGLLLAVGQGALHTPCLVHIKYRNAGKKKPLAFVGKGITFDSGGLDIKPASGMRLMKKDMGGSAAVAGLAYWVALTQPKVNCDFYLAIAENAISTDAFRPGDIIQARNGQTVEIHNTDAEGRLVLADALTVAAEAQPELIIDVATLTGAIKYGLGAQTPGLFSNSDNLAEVLLKSGQRGGDVAWRMPLIPEERGRLRSDVADMVNCTDGFGGAVTAALFLENFVEGVPWAHFDIYAWANKAQGALRQAGGSGQSVQSLSNFVSSQQY